jgi:hypothetical protein
MKKKDHFRIRFESWNWWDCYFILALQRQDTIGYFNFKLLVLEGVLQFSASIWSSWSAQIHLWMHQMPSWWRTIHFIGYIVKDSPHKHDWSQTEQSFPMLICIRFESIMIWWDIAIKVMATIGCVVLVRLLLMHLLVAPITSLNIYIEIKSKARPKFDFDFA